MASTYRFSTANLGGNNPAKYIGNEGEIFWNPKSGSLRLSDGTTVGGVDVTGLSNGFQARNNTPSDSVLGIANGATSNVDLVGQKGYVLFSITANKACRVVVYTDSASRTADAGRVQGVAPSTNSGVIAEAVFTGENTVHFSPGLFGYNNESSPTTTIPVAVTNNTGAECDIAIELSILKLEH